MWVKIWRMGVGRQDVSHDDPCRKGLRSRLRAACVIDEPFASSEFFEDLHRVKRGSVMRERRLVLDRSAKIIHLEIDVPCLSATNGPLAVDDKDGDATDATLAGCFDLIVDRLGVLVRVEVCDGLGQWMSQAPLRRKLAGRTSSLLIRHDASAISLSISMLEISLWSVVRALKRLEITVCWRDWPPFFQAR